MSLPLSDIAAAIEQLAPVCRKAGIRRVRLADGTELEFGGVSEATEAEMKRFRQFMEQGQPNDEEALNWSAPGWTPPAPAEPPAPTRTKGRRS